MMLSSRLSKVPARILMTADTVGGVWNYALELARGLEAFGVEVQIATMGAPLSHEQYKEARQIANLSIFKSDFKLEWMREPWWDVKQAGNWLLHLERRLKPDVVHLNSYAHGALPWVAPKLVVGHSCVLSWWQAVKFDKAPLSWNHYRSEVKRGICMADFLVAPSQAMMSSLQKLYGPFLPARRVIPNGRAPEFFLPGVKQEFVLCAGRLWDEAKNVNALAGIAGRLSWPVYFAGDEKDPGAALTAVAEFPNVRFLGKLWSAALSSWFSDASIYALPARYEPFGLSALEAALAGCALVLGDIPSLREIWEDAAFFVSPDSEESLEAALRDLISNQTLRGEFAKRARLRALQFSPERMARSYLDTYVELLAKPQVHASSEEEEIACVL